MHLALLQAAQGKLAMAGAFGETPEGALFIFQDVTKQVSHIARSPETSQHPKHLHLHLHVTMHPCMEHALDTTVSIQAGTNAW